MRPPILVLVTALVVPATALAQSSDVADDAKPPVLELEDTLPSDEAKLGDLEDQVNSKGLSLEPKFDLSAEQPDAVRGTSPLDHTEPEPAPGFVLKIPTD
jgi:hypothetical protein